MSYARLSRRRLLFRSFTGLEITEFDIISKEIESKYYEHERKRLSNRKRCRIKKLGIMGTKFRNKLGRYDHASDIVSGLVNFRIMQTNRTLL
jgi:hypothetical protein